MHECKKRWWLPVTIKSPWVLSMGVKLLISITVLEVIVYIFHLTTVISNLYEWDIKTGGRKLTNAIAVAYPEIVLSQFYYSVVGVMIIGLTILPLLFFYQHYIESKSIYTMLRIRENNIRIKFYIENIALSVIGILSVFLWQTILYMIGYLLYLVFVPNNNQPEQGFFWLWKGNPICFAVLLPALAMLAAFAERSKRYSILALLGLGFGLFAIYSFWVGMQGFPIIILFATIAAVLIGVYYMNKVQLT